MDKDVSELDRTQLQSLVAADAVTAVFQPIVDTEEGRIHAFEALSRPTAESGFRTPAEMFHAAESAGMLWELERITRRHALIAARNWPKNRQLFLNCSPSVVTDPRFLPALLEDMRHAQGLEPDRVVVEITELSDESMTAPLIEQSAALKKAGFLVAVDDAGAGTSGLNRIAQIRPQWIKLDLQFVRKIHADPFRQNLVRFFVHFARLSNIHLVAEGIETPEELETMVRLGARFAQGYFLARPASRELLDKPEFEEDVRRKLRVIGDQIRSAAKQSAAIGRLVEECLCLEHSISVSQACLSLSACPQAAGVVAMEGRRALGWVWRSHIEHAHRSAHDSMRLSELMNANLIRVPSSTTLQEALDVACVFEDQPPADPLLIIDTGVVKGIIRLRELIRAATRDGHVGFAGSNSLTSLPTRVQADQHLIDQIGMWKAFQTEAPGIDHSTLHDDAALVDLRRFAEYNAAFGYTVGDRLIRAVADLIDVEIKDRVSGSFVAHLGTDRFLITATVGQLGPALLQLLQRFDDLVQSWGPSLAVSPMNAPSSASRSASSSADASTADASTADASTADASTADGFVLPTPGMRVILLDGILSSITHPRELYQRESQLRHKAYTLESSSPDLLSHLVTDDRHEQSLVGNEPLRENPGNANGEFRKAA